MRFTILAIVFTGISVLMPVSAEERSIQQILSDAEAVKSSDPAEFARTLDSLKKQQSTFTRAEHYHYAYLQGYRAGFSGDIDSAIEKYRYVIDGTDDKHLKVQTTTALLNMFAVKRDYEQGYELINALFPLLSEVSDELRSQILIAKAIFFNQAADDDAALVAAQQALKNITLPRLVCFTRNLVVEAHYHLDTISDNRLFDQAIAACESANEPVATGLTLVFKARYMLSQGDTDGALTLLQSYQTLFDTVRYPRLQVDYQAISATLYFMTDNLEKAEDAAQQAIAISGKMGAARPRIEAFEVLYKIHEQRGQTDDAYRTYKRFAELEKANLDDTRLNRLAALQAKSNLQAKESQINILDKQNSLLITAAQLRTEELQNSRLLIAVLLLLSGLILVWVLINRKMHKKLRSQAQTDNLTGIANRHYFTTLADSSLRYHERTGQSLGFVIFDLDLFKNINDTYGHQVGDWTLQAVIKAIQSVCRQQDIIGRMGGEEFAVLLPGCALTKARLLAEDCRSTIAAIDTSESGVTFKITASFGVTDTDTCGYSFDELYAKADTALYRSKHEGRNQVFCYKPSEETAPFLTEQPG
ncbi:sensor domain-containing diguanylate cyclase [Alteromonas halophila]|uniref:diguanylate cyclase n=1 Tax=Alteromonas halophila TaxID=516698 RepID=A0A918JF39_9ALTE|nr:diguanylate cyclase [Alteromonas halophila]GGW74765.1 GGDEF domain-containing protein [Alteromonas halophila]